MWKPIRAALTTYLTRPACWWLSVIAVIYWSGGIVPLITQEIRWRLEPADAGEFARVMWNGQRLIERHRSGDSLVDFQKASSLLVESGGFVNSLPSADELPNLRQIEFTSSANGMWSDLAKFPQLKTVIIREVSPKAFDETTIAAIRRMPALRELFVGEHRADDPFLGFERLQSALPNVSVRPSLISMRRFAVLGGALVGLLVWTLMVMAQVAVHFLPPTAALAPKFLPAHLVTDTAIWLLGLFVSSGLIAAAGSDWLASLAFAQVVTLPITLGFAMSFPKHFLAKRVLSPWLWSALLIAVVPVLILSETIRWTDLDWFLRGQMPWLTAGILTLGVLSLLDSVSRLTRLHSTWQESGRRTPALGLDVRLAATQSSWRGAEAAKRWTLWWPEFAQSARLDRWTRSQRIVERRPKTIWAQANIVSGRDVGLLLIVVTLPFLGVLLTAIVHRDWVSRRWIESSTAIPILLSAASAVATASVWLTRRSTLAYESLLPVSRRGFIAEFWWALGLDLAPSIVWQLLVNGLASLVNRMTLAEALSTALSSTVLLIGSWLFLFSGLLLLLTLRETLATVIATCGLMIVVLFGQMAIVGLLTAKVLAGFQSNFMLAMFIVWSIALVTTCMAWRRWQRLEFGRL